MKEETICAPATSPVNSALSIIRISGSETLRAVNSIFSNAKKIKPRQAVYGSIKEDNKIIDDVVLTYYQGPASFSGEDMAEICCHGNALIVQKIITLLQKEDIRLARGGEFSQRAFLNGKIDLTEAEAINQVIKAKSDWELEASIKQMHGSLKTEIQNLRKNLILLKANIECGIDFIEQDIEQIEQETLNKDIAQINQTILDLTHRCKLSEKVSQGIDLPIVGKPNVGKSSLLNLLLNEERALVSDIPGTTRDLIKEHLQINGLHINLVDTAGIRQSENPIEKMGIERSQKEIANANLIILVVDGNNGLNNSDHEIIKNLADKEVITLINKSDVAIPEKIEKVKKSIPFPTISFSAKTGDGLKELEEKISANISENFEGYDNSFLADTRIIALLQKSSEIIQRTANLATIGEQPEILAYEIQNLLDTLAEITGEISPDDILHSIFSNFCIGK